MVIWGALTREHEFEHILSLLGFAWCPLGVEHVTAVSGLCAKIRMNCHASMF